MVGDARQYLSQVRGGRPGCSRLGNIMMIQAVSIEREFGCGGSEIAATGTLTPPTWTAVRRLLTLEPGYVPRAGDGDPTQPKIDEAFLACLERHVQGYNARLKLGYDAVADYFDIRAVPPEDIMKRSQQYEKAARNQLDWAQQVLIESKKRRQKDQTILGVKGSVN
jgi:hypothetical protein